MYTTQTASCEGKNKSWITELLGGGDQPVLWLKQNKNALYNRYKQECEQSGVKPISLSMFYNGISAVNFRIIAEKAGLCNICTELGAENFIALNELFLQIGKHLKENYMLDKTEELGRRAKSLKGYLLSEIPANLKTHSDCATHCAGLSLSDHPSCGSVSEHQLNYSNCLEKFQLFRDIEETIDMLENSEMKEKLGKIEENMNNYIGHIVRGKYQWEQKCSSNSSNPPSPLMVLE